MKYDLKQHFTNATHINNLMGKLLGCTNNKILLEPSVGNGALLKNILGKPKKLVCYDVDKDIFKSGSDKLTHFEIDFLHKSFIDDYIEKTKNNLANQEIDLVLANPPYGLEFSVDYRKNLKTIFPNLYVKESYSLFLYISLMQLKEDGRYVFLIPDTFLTNNRHISIRKFLLDYAKPTHIIRMPSKAFETINFKYGNLCIIAGNKSKMIDKDIINWFETDVINTDFKEIDYEKISGSKFIEKYEAGWSRHYLVDDSLINYAGWKTLGDLADCKTGIYTGDNESYIGFNPNLAKRKSNGHVIDWEKDVYTDELSQQEKLEGLANSDKKYVKFIRGGHRKIFEEPTNAILWSKNAINFYKSNKKARFQNSNFYFKEGIAVPMVSSSRISASYINNCVFDQGVVGVFPKNDKIINPLLVYLNSSLASKLMKGMVNGSANNSANYLKKLPIPDISSEFIDLSNNLVKNIKSGKTITQEDIDLVLDKILPI